MSMSDVLVMTSYPPSWQALADITCATHKKWADAWRCDYYADCSELQDNYFNPHTKTISRVDIHGFVKLDLFLHFFNKYKENKFEGRDKYKAVLWLDADLVITNYNKNPFSLPHYTASSIAIKYPPNYENDIIMPYDYNGHNATVIYCRNTFLANQFIWACNNTGRKLFLGHDWYEMEAMRYFSQTPPYNNLIKHLSIKELCPILGKEYEPYVPPSVSGPYSWEKGDWSCHLSALPLHRRIELSQQLVQDLNLL